MKEEKRSSILTVCISSPQSSGEISYAKDSQMVRSKWEKHFKRMLYGQVNEPQKLQFRTNFIGVTHKCQVSLQWILNIIISCRKLHTHKILLRLFSRHIFFVICWTRTNCLYIFIQPTVEKKKKNNSLSSNLSNNNNKNAHENYR